MFNNHRHSFKIFLSFIFISMLLLSTLIVEPSQQKESFPPPVTVQNDTDFGAGIQRTMTLLATSTPEHHNKVKILFYGQSITKQKWWIDVANDLKKRFPNADLVIENRALGGFDASRLIRPAEHDLYPFYPDLTIFHVYGGDPEYEAIIANIRSRTTSEIAFHSDHITWLPTGTEADTFDELKTYEWHNYHSFHWLARIAKKYGCELMEIRRPWRQYLKELNLQPKALLSDNIHLNDQGNFLLASLIKPHLRYDPKFPTDLWKNLVRNYQVGTDIQWQDGKLVLDFEGNRIDAIAAKSSKSNSASAKILIDGKKPSEYPELYTITRPSNAIDVDWPAIIQISSEKPLLVEDWTAKITEINQDSSQFKFEVFGSKTGRDGSGTSDSKFVSNSGRIVIEARNWWLKTSQELSGKSTPKGFEIKWQVKPMFVDNYTAHKVDNPAFESSTILAQNLTNSKHKLEIIADQNSPVPILALRVYKPPLIPSIESQQPTSTP